MTWPDCKPSQFYHFFKHCQYNFSFKKIVRRKYFKKDFLNYSTSKVVPFRNTPVAKVSCPTSQVFLKTDVRARVPFAVFWVPFGTHPPYFRATATQQFWLETLKLYYYSRFCTRLPQKLQNSFFLLFQFDSVQDYLQYNIFLIKVKKKSP